MRNFLLMTVALACGAAGAGGPPNPGEWTLVFEDEFNGAAADLDAAWEFQNGPSGHILCSRWRENAVLEDGLLKLVARKEERGGQAWTAASLWTRRTFQYGYFECRYRYAPVTGTNNSFWIMTRLPRNAPGRFEIDINEGHFPNEVNMNLHNWSGEHWTRGGRWYFGGPPAPSKQDDAGFSFPLASSVRTSRLRFISRDPGSARIMELRVFPPSAEGYPSVFPNTLEAQPDVPNLALQADVEASSVLDARYGPEHSVDGRLENDSRWVSAPGAEPHTLTLSFGEPREIGCIQFISGWRDGEHWKGIVEDYRLEWWDGQAWQAVPGVPQPGQAQDEDGGATDNLGTTFHTYALHWTQEELIYLFDGEIIRRIPNEICHGPAPVWLSLAIMKWAGPVTDAIHGKSMDVDYVRVWQRKAPPAHQP